MCIVDTIRQLSHARGISITTLEQTVGLGNGTIGKWRKQSPSCDKLKLVADYLSVSIDYLLTGKEKSPSAELSEDEQELLDIFKELPEKQKIMVLERAKTLAELLGEQGENVQNGPYGPKTIMTTINIAEVAAGAGISTPFTIDNVFKPKEVPYDAVPEGTDCGVPINGDSMEPDYPNGCIVWVKLTKQIQDGDVIIATLNGEPYCKIYQPDGLHSFNENYDIIRVSDSDNFDVFGKVIGCYKA